MYYVLRSLILIEEVNWRMVNIIRINIFKFLKYRIIFYFVYRDMYLLLKFKILYGNDVE